MSDPRPARNSYPSHALSIGAGLVFCASLVVAGAGVIVIGAGAGAGIGIVVIGASAGAGIGIVGLRAAIPTLLNNRMDGDRRYASGSVLRKVGWLLPAGDREDYVEEWRSWLRDMRETGQSWYHRLVELLGIVLIAAPRLAITLRLGRRVVD